MNDRILDDHIEPPFDITGLILAGGESRRMGRPKAELSLGGKSLLQLVVDRLSPLCREIVIVAKHPASFLHLNRTVVRDLVPGLGPLGGLATGLFYAHFHWSLCVACDLPFLNTELLTYLIRTALAASGGPRAIVPKGDKGWQPLVALYSRNCLNKAKKLLDQGERQVFQLMDQGVKWQAVPETELMAFDPDLESFLNLNTPGDYEDARARLGD